MPLLPSTLNSKLMSLKTKDIWNSTREYWLPSDDVWLVIGSWLRSNSNRLTSRISMLERSEERGTLALFIPNALLECIIYRKVTSI